MRRAGVVPVGGSCHASRWGGVRTVARRLADGAAEALWPTRCLGCDRPGTLLCPDCAAALPAIDQACACPCCGAPFGSLVCTECTDCLEHDDEGDCDGGSRPLELLDGACCYGVHAWPLDRIVRGYKDAGERRAAALLAQMIVTALRARGWGDGRDGLWSDFDAVSFVPCTPQAFARRGFDHMEQVARISARELGLPLKDALARYALHDQRGLGRRGRAGNARASLVPVLPVEGARILLLDDVLTTGATLAAAAGALKAAGATSVVAATAARAW